ncbi:hypothetical protein ONZ43_g363 [Nemania bipapillata]|uniref:Uncharacterized protein n=1 Tax=Nemania bipapillata TaxID=110536 RepID=A0ACC2J8T9_9PEZI|nr:hypothetical protein ONZ43_g363 [Nemania bipapillata]
MTPITAPPSPNSDAISDQNENQDPSAGVPISSRRDYDLRRHVTDDSELIWELTLSWTQLPPWKYTHMKHELVGPHFEELTIVKQEFTGKLTGLTEVLIVLRRIFAARLALMPGIDVRHGLLSLACYDLATLTPESSPLIRAISQLGLSWCANRDPSFESIINSAPMGDLWNMPLMRLFQEWSLYSLNRVYWSPRRVPYRMPLQWANDMLVYDGSKSIEDFMEQTICEVTPRPGAYEMAAFNHPDFIRVKYSAPSQEDGDKEYPRFQDVQSFTISAHKVDEGEKKASKLDPKPKAKALKISSCYILIACVFERAPEDCVPAVRTYAITGQHTLPMEYDAWECKQRIGDPGTTCFLFYTRCPTSDYVQSSYEIYPGFDPRLQNPAHEPEGTAVDPTDSMIIPEPKLRRIIFRRDGSRIEASEPRTC